MSKWAIRIVIPLFTFLLGIAAAVWYINESRKQELRIVSPNSRLEDLFCGVIDRRVREADLLNLRRVILPSGDLEVRVWVGFGLNGEDGFILRRSANQWSAIHLSGMAERPPLPKSQQSLAAPKSGWGRAWQRLVDAGILTLPDGMDCEIAVLDGVGFVVEINQNKTYRSYMYSNPWYERPGYYCKGAKQMVTIGKILAEEYGLKWFDVGR